MFLLPPAFRRSEEGIVFTGACLSTFRGVGGYPIPADGGMVNTSFLTGSFPFFPTRGLPPHKVRMWGTPSKVSTGVHPSRSGPKSGRGDVGSPSQNSTAHTCYVAGGMPLAFTQEDFLVCFYFNDVILV